MKYHQACTSIIRSQYKAYIPCSDLYIMVYIVGWNTRIYIRASRHHSKRTYFTYSNEINDTFGLHVKQHFAENRTTHAKHLVTAKADMTSPLQMTLATVINKLAKKQLTWCSLQLCAAPSERLHMSGCYFYRRHDKAKAGHKWRVGVWTATI